MAYENDKNDSHKGTRSSRAQTETSHPRLITCVITRDATDNATSPEMYSLSPRAKRPDDAPPDPPMRPRLSILERSKPRPTRSSSIPKADFSRSEVMNQVEKWLLDHPPKEGRRSFGDVEHIREGDESEPRDVQISKGNTILDGNPRETQVPSVGKEMAEATNLLKEQHVILNQLMKELPAVQGDLADARRQCQRLQQENDILCKRLIRKSCEISELQMQFDALSVRFEPSKQVSHQIHQETSSYVTPPDSTSNGGTIPTAEGGLSLRNLFRRSKSALVLQRDPMEALLDVNRKSNMMKWLDDALPSLEDEVGDESKRIKALLVGNKSVLHP